MKKFWQRKRRIEKLPIPVHQLRSIVESEFQVEEVCEKPGKPVVFKVKLPSRHGEALAKLAGKLKPHNVLPLLRRGEDSRPTLIFLQWRRQHGGGLHTQLASLTLTCLFVLLSGYVAAHVWNRLTGSDIILHTILFAGGILGIIGVHELGHKLVLRLEGVKAEGPYFIPGPPFPLGFGTFGAVILQDEPPLNRNQLFDMGISGPLTGLAATLLVAAVAVGFTMPAPSEASGPTLPMPLCWRLLEQLLLPGDLHNAHLLIPPVGLAAWLGFLISFLNFLPAWQLDGGHIARAMFGSRGHLACSAFAMLVMALTGFWFFAAFILVMLAAAKNHLGPLDDLTPLSKKRRIIGLLAYALIPLLCGVALT